MKELNQTNENLQPSKLQDKYKFDPIEQLELKVNKANKQDYQEIVQLLTMYLTYPSHQMGELHMESERLGRQDLKSEIQERLRNDKKSSQARDNIQLCPCCGLVRQVEQIPSCTNLTQINNIGISTYLYFQTIKHLIILLLILSLLYSIYALVTNVSASNEYQNLIINSTSIPYNKLSSLSYVALSLGSKQVNNNQTNKTAYFIQCWIGLAVVAIWLLTFFCMIRNQSKQQAKVEEQTISASDFTVVMENMPNDIGKEQLQKKFDDYYKSIQASVPEWMKKPFQIQKINVGQPFYLNQDDFKNEELDKLKEEHQQIIKTFISWVEERKGSSTFTSTKDQRQKVYNRFKEVIEKEVQKYKQIGDKIQASIKSKSAEKQTTIIFVTLKTSHAMRLLAGLNDPSISSKLRYYLSCCRGGNKFQFIRDGQDFQAKIERAPEPEDLIWTNLAVPTGEYVKRKIITYTVTFILLGGSFGIVYGLSRAQQNDSSNQILSFVISITISVINVILSQVIQKLSIYEMQYTTTKYQTSLSLKSIFASLINTILIPMMVSSYIKEDYYGKNGLASDVFMLGLTNSMVSPILKIIDITYIINRITKYFASRPYSRLPMNQSSLNTAYELTQFEVGQEYVYLVSLYLFTCFFVSLQPIISFFALAGMSIMYWAQKYTIFNKMKRPIPGTQIMNLTMSQLILLGGIFYSLGSLTWSNLLPDGIPKEALVPNLIALGLSFAVFLIPYRAIVAVCMDEAASQNLVFQEKRLILTSEYDRLNPSTAAESLKQFQEYYIKKLNDLNTSGNEEQKKKLAQQMGRQNMRRPTQNIQQNPFGSMFNQMPMYGQPMMMPQYRPPQMGFGFQPMAPMQSGFQQLGFQQPNFNRPPVQQPGFQQTNLIQPPGFQQPGFQQPGFQQPNFNRPPVQQVGFQQPGFQQQGLQQPGFQQQGLQQPGFQQPGFQQPGFQQPGFQQPGFQQPGFQMPGFQMQGLQQPNFGFKMGFG